MARAIIVKASTSAKYAGTIAAPTVANGAIRPDLLASGTIGIYGIQTGTAIAANEDKLVLIMNTAATAAAGKVDADNFKGTIFRIVQGSPTGVVNTPDFKIVNISTVKGAKYVAPIYQVSYIGYNDVTDAGSFNLPTLVFNDEALLGGVERNNNAEAVSRVNYTASRLTPTSTGYDIAVALSAKINLGTPVGSGSNVPMFTASVVSNGARTAFAATASVTNGSTTVTIVAHGLSIGDFVKFEGVLYKIVTTPTADTFTIDRAYEGVTNAAIATADADSGSYATLTAYGLKLTNLALNPVEFFVDGVLSNADVTVQVGSNEGNGTPVQVLKQENDEAPYRGDINTLTSINKHLPRFTDSSKTYNNYCIDAVAVSLDQSGVHSDTSNRFNVYVAFEVEANTTGFPQSDFENILKQLLETNRGLAAGTVVTTGF